MVQVHWKTDYLNHQHNLVIILFNNNWQFESVEIWAFN